MDCVLLGMKAASIPRTAFASLLLCVRGKRGAPEEIFHLRIVTGCFRLKYHLLTQNHFMSFERQKCW